MAFKDLDKGEKVDIHLGVEPKALLILDTLRGLYNCSRAAIIEALADEFGDADLFGKVAPTQRRHPGYGTVHVTIAAKKLAIIDKHRRKHRCARASVVEAWLLDFAERENMVLTGVKPGRRPGGGRKKAPREDPMAFLYDIVPELKRKI